ncbi:MAG: tetratricopeptide repeat protein [Bryobacterales bacterium]
MGSLDEPGEGLAVIPASESLDLVERDPGQAASMLGANLIAHGRLVGEDGRITAELALWNAEAGKTGGTRRLDLLEDDPIAARESVAAALAEMLGVELPGLESPGDAATKAYLHYLPARGYLVRESDPDSVDRAIAEFHRALAEDQQSGAVYAGLARAYWRKYDLAKDQRSAQQAIQAAENAIAYSPDSADAHMAAGYVHLGTGRYEEAVADFHQALELKPDDNDALIGLGRAYEKDGAPEAAQATLQKAIDLRPNLWLGYKWMGLFHYNAGRYEQAIEQYERILELAPNSAQAHLNIGVFHVLSERYGEARMHWEKAVEIEPMAGVLGNLLKLSMIEEDYEAAVGFGEQAVALDSAQHRLWASLGAAYLKLGREADAREAHERAIQQAQRDLEINPEDFASIVMLGHYHAMAGDRDKALELTEKGLAMREGRPDVLVDAAETYGELGLGAKARETAQEAFDEGVPVSAIRGSRNLQPMFPELTRGDSLRPDSRSRGREQADFSH